MQTGLDKRQIEALKALGRRWAGDPVQLRFVVVLVLLAIGWLGVERPLAAGYAEARTAHADARKQARMAEELRHLSGQQKLYADRVAVPADLVDWQNYVLASMQGMQATLISLEPKNTVQKQPFSVVEMEIVARGSDYAEFVDLMDRLEHGERFVRLEKVRIERQQANLYVTIQLKGLVKGSAKVAGKEREPEGEAGAAPEAAAAGSDGSAGAPEAAGVDEAGPRDGPDAGATEPDAPAGAAEAGDD